MPLKTASPLQRIIGDELGHESGSTVGSRDKEHPVGQVSGRMLREDCRQSGGRGVRRGRCWSGQSASQYSSTYDCRANPWLLVPPRQWGEEEQEIKSWFPSSLDADLTSLLAHTLY